MWNMPAGAGAFDPQSPTQRSCYFDRIIPPHKMTEINKWYAAGIISHRTAESQREGGQTHNETESSHLTTSLIFILFMQGVGYLRSKFLSGCSGLDSTPVLCNFKVQLEICTIGRGGGIFFQRREKRKTVDLFGICFQTFCGWCRPVLKKSTLQME